MIINAVLHVVLWIVSLILSAIDVFSLPEQVLAVVAEFVSVLIRGAQIVAAYTHFSYLLVLLGIIIAVNSIMLVYKIILWIVRKIPFVHIS